jgi:D-threo-aldose 1-dehydrogenase
MGSLGRSRIGRTKLYVTRLGLGCYELSLSATQEQAEETLRAAVQQGVNYIDTAPLYGFGLSEERLGKALCLHDREKLVISTKVGVILDPSRGKGSESMVRDYSRGAVLRSWESSLSRLGVDAVDILFIHDPDNHYEQAVGEAYPTLAELRDDDVIRAIGVGMNQWEMELRFAEEGDVDCFMLAGRYTLLEQGALPEFLPYCREKNISVIIAGPYNSGVLADPEKGTYNYREAPPGVVAKALQIKKVCDRHGVPLKAAALQFPLGHPAVSSVVPGTRSPSHQEENLRMISHSIHDSLWDELKEEGLLDQEAPTPS